LETDGSVWELTSSALSGSGILNLAVIANGLEDVVVNAVCLRIDRVIRNVCIDVVVRSRNIED